MSVYRRAYRFRMRPNAAQRQSLMRQAGACRFIWNWALSRKKDEHAATGKTLTAQTLCLELTNLKRQEGMEWLNEVANAPLQQTLRDLDRAYRNFFDGRAGFPLFKSKKRDTPRFRYPQHVRVCDGYTFVPKIGLIRIRQSQPVDLPTKSATFKRDATGHWYVTLTAEFELPDVALPAPDPAKVIGIDLGLIDFATFNTGSGLDPIPAPKFFRKGQRKLCKAQRVLSRRKPGSNRRAKSRHRVAVIHQEIANQREDFLHKLSTKLVNERAGICLEDLFLKGLTRTKLAKSFNDASMGEFRRQLEYKSRWCRKHLAVIDRWFPSSKMCRNCKAINRDLTLKDREWDCPSCGAHHDRDVNAANNIKDEGLRLLAAGHAERLNARGTRVRPVKAGSGR